MGVEEKSARAAEARASMNPALRAQLQEIEDELASVAGDEIRHRYRVGTVLLRVMKDGERYGERGVQALATALGIGVMTLYRHARVAQHWTAAEVTAFQELRDALGRPLSWSHLVALAERPSARDKWIKRTLANAWSARRLEREMGLGASAGARGDASAEDSTRSAILRSLGQTEQWTTTVGGTMSPLVDRLEDVRDWTPELDELRARLLGAVRDAHRRTGEVLARLERVAGDGVASAPARSSPRLSALRGRRETERAS